MTREPKPLNTLRPPPHLLHRANHLPAPPDRIPKTHRKLNGLTDPSRSDIIRVALHLGLNRLSQPLPF